MEEGTLASIPISRGGGSMETALRGPIAQADGDSGEEKGDGTQQSGYVTPDLGPFECENCVHFEQPTTCNHPEVVNDPEVQGQVEAEGCCNFFKSAHNESQAEEHSESHGELGGEGG
jgi:hypothetical protein